MAKIALTVEASDEYKNKMFQIHQIDKKRGSDIGEVMAHSAYLTAVEAEAAAIVSPTMTGNTARLLAKFRPEQPVIAATPNETVQRQLMLNWGVFPLLVPTAEDSEEMTQNAMRVALDAGLLKKSDKVVMVAGMPIISPVVVNTIRLLFVGNILARGLQGGGTKQKIVAGKRVLDAPVSPRATGRVVRAENLEEALVALRKKSGEILVTRNLDMSYVPILRVIEGLIIENPTDISEETLSMINPNLVWLSQVKDAMKILEPGFTITIDSNEKLVYEGTL